jgi:hypothetical protein
MRPDEARELEQAIVRAASQIKITASMAIGNPPILWAGVHRLPDGSIGVEEVGDRRSVSFVLKARDQPSYYRITYSFQGAKLAETATHDVTDAEHRRWKASASWPKGWR